MGIDRNPLYLLAVALAAAAFFVGMPAASAQTPLGYPYVGGAFQVVAQGVHAQAGMIGLVIPGVGVRGDVSITFGGNYFLAGNALYHGTFLPGSPVEGYFGGGLRLGFVTLQETRRTLAGAGVLAGGAFSVGPAGVFGEAGADWLAQVGLIPSVRIGVRFYP